ncbi:NADH oxidase [Phenylobacterium sp.]|uniref:NADH oxidase n=1 Tax=Phenylobacterium sp. TaxID=1871053 RepID=UPI0025EAC383|nr:NADH oxidase [Phenylobacterium sp.]
MLIRVQAAPINPGDLGLLLGPADLSTLKVTVGKTTAAIPASLLTGVRGRIGQSLAVGVEGAGTVIAAGNDEASQALVGRMVAVFGGAMFAEYRVHRTADVLVLPNGTAASEGASCFANPMTALGMIETMRMEGHRALVHTAAASNLGQILNRICLRDDVQLVNIVRSDAQAGLLRQIGARHIVNTGSPTFTQDLVAALTATGATLAFDAVGGGRLTSQILSGMERAQAASGAYSRYGSSVHKQVYIYGGLATGPTELLRDYGMAWGVGGWILTGFLAKAGPDRVKSLRRRVVDELTSTFASNYTSEISLRDALRPEVIAAYHRKRTGEKYLINPARS